MKKISLVLDNERVEVINLYTELKERCKYVLLKFVNFLETLEHSEVDPVQWRIKDYETWTEKYWNFEIAINTGTLQGLSLWNLHKIIEYIKNDSDILDEWITYPKGSRCFLRKSEGLVFQLSIDNRR
jgi:hypothetical protein